MKWVHVRSSNVAAVGYDKERRVLQVEFLGGSIYEYDNIPLEVFNDLPKQQSIGRYIRETISGRPFRRVR
jgi:hypothetical protein